MRPVPREERGSPPHVVDVLAIRAASSAATNTEDGLSTDDGLLDSHAGAVVDTLDEDPSRPIRNGSLRDLLDEEFQRNYRFEGISDFFSDLKGFLKKVVVREEELEEFGEFLAGAVSSSLEQRPEKADRRGSSDEADESREAG